MSNDLNQCSFIGRLAADPEIRYMPNGKAVANIRIAVGSQWNDKSTGDRKESVEWVPVTFYDGLAGVVGEYLRKGSQVFVQGRFQTRSWEKDGIKRYTTEIIANQMQMLGGKREQSAESEPRAKAEPVKNAEKPTNAEDFSDEIPF